MTDVKLPEAWMQVPIEDILAVQEDGKLIHQGWSPQCDGVPATDGEWGVLKTTAVQDGYYLEHENKRLPIDKSPKPRIEVRRGDLLITNAGPRSRCGVICLVSETRSQLMISGKIYRLRFPDTMIDSRFVESWLRTALIQKELNDRKTGINESGLNMTQARFLTLPVIVAPLAEQKNIANSLGTLLALVDSSKIRLEKIPQILKHFRQSVLASALSGKLTEGWREINPSEKWKTVTLLDVIQSKPRNGYSPKGVEYDTTIKNLTLSAITKGYFLEGCFKYVDIDIADDSYLWVKNSDILIQRANSLEYVGISAIYEGKDNKYIYPDLMMKFRVNESILTKYLHYSLLSEATREYFRENASGTTGNMPKINQGTVSATPINLPTISEQTEIVRRVEQLFAYADTIEKQMQAALLRVNNLTQSILAKAFRGELTAQWRAENPDLINGENSAEALLVRIKQERLKNKPVKRGKGNS